VTAAKQPACRIRAEPRRRSPRRLRPNKGPEEVHATSLRVTRAARWGQLGAPLPGADQTPWAPSVCRGTHHSTCASRSLSARPRPQASYPARYTACRGAPCRSFLAVPLNITSHHEPYMRAQSAQRAAVSMGRARAETAAGITVRISHKQVGGVALAAIGRDLAGGALNRASGLSHGAFSMSSSIEGGRSIRGKCERAII
jgi:hypothetical protein